MTSALPKRYIRMWHTDTAGTWCHAWDVEESEYKLWKQGEKALSSKAVILAKTGEHPAVRSRVSCGTCSSVDISPKLMKQELVMI